MGIKNKDFVELEYTGKVKEEDLIFDTTDEKLAKENNLHNESATYGPVIVCIGEGQVLQGLDKQLVGKEPGKEYTIELQPENAFGKKDPKLIQLVPTNKFKQQNIQPVPGLQLNLDGMLGTIKTVSGGRTLVDFNHPLSGKEIVYQVKVNKLITDDKEKLKSYLQLALNQKEVNIVIENNIAKITLKKEIPKEAQEQLSSKIKEIMPTIQKLEFTGESVKK